MIVLDTNVLSELARHRPEPTVIEWLDRQDSHELVITALTAAEIRAGIALLPEGRREREIAVRMEAILVETFAGYVMPFDIDSSAHYAEIVKRRTRAGRPIGTFDAQIAAVCAQHQATLATRNTSDFADVGVQLINPWES